MCLCVAVKNSTLVVSEVAVAVMVTVVSIVIGPQLITDVVNLFQISLITVVNLFQIG